MLSSKNIEKKLLNTQNAFLAEDVAALAKSI